MSFWKQKEEITDLEAQGGKNENHTESSKDQCGIDTKGGIRKNWRIGTNAFKLGTMQDVSQCFGNGKNAEHLRFRRWFGNRMETPW